VANKKTFRRYGRTTVRDKRSLVRSLNSFTKQYKCVYIDKVYLNEKGQIEFGRAIGLSFSQDSQKKLGIEEDRGLIYKEDIAYNDLSSYELILEAIDNLISINRRDDYKKALKAILNEYSKDGVSFMFKERYENLINLKIQQFFECSDAYAKKIYNQLKNRIKYRYTGVYSKNDSATQMVNALRPHFLASSDIQQSKIEFVLQREWLYSNDIIEGIKNKMDLSDYKEEPKDILDELSEYFSITISKDLINEDSKYYDAVEFLKFLYFQELNGNAPYPNPDYKPYEYEFITQWAEENCKTEDNAKKYIIEQNEIFLANEEEEDEYDPLADWYEVSKYHSIEEEAVNEIDADEMYRENAMSITAQWNKFYDMVLDGVLSKNLEDNIYYQVYKYATELNNELDFLVDNNVFLDNGAINEYCPYLGELRQELLKKFKDTKDKHSKIAQLMRIEKKRWKQLYEVVGKHSIFTAAMYFDYERLEF